MTNIILFIYIFIEIWPFKTKKLSNSCFHCGLDCEQDSLFFDDKIFCCNGCKTVYQIFSDNNLTSYYDLDKNPGITPKEIRGKYDILENQKIVEKTIPNKYRTMMPKGSKMEPKCGPKVFKNPPTLGRAF